MINYGKQGGVKTRSFWLRMQALAGVAAFALFMRWGWVEHREPFYTYFYLFAWASFLWVIDRILAARTGKNPLQHLGHFLWLFFVSTTFWLIFEVLNFRLRNWAYIGVPVERWLRWPGYALSFATVIPGILMLRKLIDSYWQTKNPLPPGGGGSGWGGSPPSSPSPIKGEGTFGYVSSRIYTGWAFTLGLGMMLLPLVWPRFFFPLIWGGLFFLLEPWVQRAHGHSLLRDWKARRWRQTGTLVAAGLVCGLFWEGCNFGAGSKWIYTLPYWNFGRLFEMPALGFLGFLPFALEVHAYHQAAVLYWRRKRFNQRFLLILGVALFWIAAFLGIDHWTVAGWR